MIRVKTNESRIDTVIDGIKIIIEPNESIEIYETHAELLKKKYPFLELETIKPKEELVEESIKEPIEEIIEDKPKTAKVSSPKKGRKSGKRK